MARSQTFSNGSSIPEQADALDGPDVWVSVANTDGATTTGGGPDSSSLALAVVGRGLHDLEAQLRCGICGDFMRNPVMVVPCSHTFCSSCIRLKFRSHISSTARSTTCPACNKIVDTSGVEFSKCLVPNRSVDNLVHQFRCLRGPLLCVLQQQQQQQNNILAHTNSPATNSKNSPVESSENGQDKQTSDQQRPRRSNRNTNCKVKELIPTEDVLGNNNKNCRSRHSAAAAESSMTLSTDGQLPPELGKRRNKLSRTIYRGLKKTNLQDLCRREGLSTWGSEKDLQYRHSAWIDKYNAECDSLRPRSVAELRQELEKEERDKKAGAFTSSACGNKELACVAKLFARLTELGKREAKWKGIPSCSDESFDAILAMKFEELIQQHRTHFPLQGLRRRSLAEIEAAIAAKESAVGAVAGAAVSAELPTDGAERGRKLEGETLLEDSFQNESHEKPAVAPVLFSNPYTKGRVSNPVHTAADKPNDVQGSFPLVSRHATSDDSMKASPVEINPNRKRCNSNDLTSICGTGSVLVQEQQGGACYNTVEKSSATMSASSKLSAPSINPYLSVQSSSGSAAKADIKVAACMQQQQQNDAFLGVSQPAPLHGSTATVAPNRPVDSDLFKNGQNASGSTVSGIRSTEFSGSHIDLQSSGHMSEFQHQSVASVSSSSSENLMQHQTTNTSAKKRKSPKQNQLNLSGFGKKPKMQRSSDEQAGDRRPSTTVGNNKFNSAFGSSWTCSFCFCENKSNPGSRARCLDCTACRQCKRGPCICNSNESSPTEKDATICIDC